MNYEKFLKDNLIKKQKADFKQISYQLQRAIKDLKTAEANLGIDLTWSLAIAYHAMIRAGRALMYSKGGETTLENLFGGKAPPMAGAILMFLRLAFGSPHRNSLIAIKKQPLKDSRPPETRFAGPLKFILTYISFSDNIITVSDNGGCNAR